MHVQTYVLRQWGRTRALRTCVRICMYHSQSESVTFICMSTKHCSYLSFPNLSSTVLTTALACTAISSRQIFKQRKCCCCSLLGSLDSVNLLDSVSFTQNFPYWLQLLLICFREKILRKVCYWRCFCRSGRPSQCLPSLCLDELI